MKHISTDCHYDKHELLNLDLQNDYSQNKPGVFMMITGTMEQYLNALMRIKTAVLSL